MTNLIVPITNDGNNKQIMLNDIPLNHFKDEKELINALIADAEPMDGYIDKKLEIVGHRISKTLMSKVDEKGQLVLDEDGSPIQQEVNIIFIFTKDKKTIFSMSKTFLVNYKAIVEIFGNPTEWKNPIVIKVSHGVTKKGNRMYKVRLV